MSNPNTKNLISQITSYASSPYYGLDPLFASMSNFFQTKGMIAFDDEACKQLISEIYIYTISSKGDPVDWNAVRGYCTDCYLKRPYPV